MKKKISIILGLVLVLAVVAISIYAGTGGKIFQGALYNLRPVYQECHIEGTNGSSKNTDDCEYFFQKLESAQNENKTFLADGEYTVFAKYSNPELPENIIPIRIKNKQLECTYLESGYQPQISISDVNSPLSSELISQPREIPVGSNGLIAKINFSKNNHIYPYDDNICEGSFKGKIYDQNKKELGEVKLDRNGFINSRPLVNELLINNAPYYNANLKDFNPGNIYLGLNFAPEMLFKFAIPCSNKIPSVELPTLSTDKDVTIKIKGLDKNYFTTCQDKLYWSIQNTNNADDLHVINLDYLNSTNYQLSLKNIPALNLNNGVKVTFPQSFLLKLHLKDRGDSNDVKTLGSGVITVTGYQPKVDPSTINKQNPTTPTQNKKVKNSTKTTPSTTSVPITDLSATTNANLQTNVFQVKVRHSAEHPVVLPLQSEISQ